MLPNLKEVYRPKTLNEALKILKKGKGKIVPMAGCTSLAASENPSVEGLADLAALKLDYVKSSKTGLSVGAMATLEEIAVSAGARKYCAGVLSDCAASVGKITNRNMITAGGNIVQSHPWSALPVACLALDAEVVVAGPGKKSVAAEEFFSKSPKQQLSHDKIVAEIRFPAGFAAASGKYVKFALTENDYPLISVCVAAKIKNGRVEFVRIAAGALALMPQRFKAAEKIIEGAAPGGTLVEKAAESAAAAAVVGNDIRVSKEYKRAVLAKLIQSALVETLK